MDTSQLQGHLATQDKKLNRVDNQQACNAQIQASIVHAYLTGSLTRVSPHYNSTHPAEDGASARWSPHSPVPARGAGQSSGLIPVLSDAASRLPGDQQVIAAGQYCCWCLYIMYTGVGDGRVLSMFITASAGSKDQEYNLFL